MTFNRFKELLNTQYPEAHACAHGKFGGTEGNGKVEINFTPNGKCYCYYGSYQDILKKVGINVAYRADIDAAERRLARLIEEDGTENPFSLFNRELIDNSAEIARQQEYLDSLRSYILVD